MKTNSIEKAIKTSKNYICCSCYDTTDYDNGDGLCDCGGGLIENQGENFNSWVLEEQDDCW